jgi:DNA-binding response OmpR family regulator
MGAARVLIVDRNAIARLALSELLLESGYDARAAADEHAAVALLDAFAPHVVLVEADLGRSNGVTLGRALAARALEPVLVLMWTTRPSPSESERPHVVKPVTVAELYHVVALAAAHAGA